MNPQSNANRPAPSSRSSRRPGGPRAPVVGLVVGLVAFGLVLSAGRAQAQQFYPPVVSAGNSGFARPAAWDPIAPPVAGAERIIGGGGGFFPHHDGPDEVIFFPRARPTINFQLLDPRFQVNPYGYNFDPRFAGFAAPQQFGGFAPSGGCWNGNCGGFVPAPQSLGYPGGRVICIGGQCFQVR